MTRFPSRPDREPKAVEQSPTRWTGNLPAAFTAEDLRSLARECADDRMRGRLLVIASIYDGMAPSDLARIWGFTVHVLEHMLRRFVESGLRGISDQPPRAEKTSRQGEPSR